VELGQPVVHEFPFKLYGVMQLEQFLDDPEQVRQVW
jgi:hypothetical protein